MIEKPILLDLPMPIVTPRLKIVPWHPDHTEAFHQMREESLPDLKPWMVWADTPATRDDVREMLTNGYARFVLRETLNMLAFTLEGELVASTGLHEFNWRVPMAGVGYWCRSSARGKGYVTEAANALIRYGFQAIGLRKVSIGMDSENVRSEAVAKRLGLVKEFEQMGAISTLHPDQLRKRLEYSCFDTSRLPPLDVKW